jgi:hypothetical protein
VANNGVRWGRANRRLLALFGPLLILTGLSGFLLPPEMALMSTAAPYNFFHIGFGVLGTGLVVARRRRGIAAFNFSFGVIDLYQALAGLTGLYPSAIFRYRPADHVLHVVVGLVLAIVGWNGLRELGARGGAS